MNRIVRAILLALATTGLAAADSVESSRTCSGPWAGEQAIVRSLLNLDTNHTRELIATLNIDSALVPSREFYQGLATWYQGYQVDSEENRSLGIKTLHRALDKLEQRFNHDPSMANRLALGIASGHTARILFAEEAYLTGYNIARTAREHIEYFIEAADPDHPGYADALLLKGLFEIHTHRITSRNNWLVATIHYKGDRHTGIKYLERAIQGAGVFQLEGVRALLGEVTWETPAFCAYTGLIDNVGERLGNNRDIAVLRQGLLLKCGFAERALEVNQQYLDANRFTKLPDNPLQHARLRIAASLGDVEGLSSMQPGSLLRHHHRIALANAHDVAGQHKSARKIYRQLSGDTDADEGIRAVAQTRMKYPFRAPTVSFVKPFQGNLGPCTENQ